MKTKTPKPPKFHAATFTYTPKSYGPKSKPAEPIVAIEYSREKHGKGRAEWLPALVETTSAGYGLTHCHGGEVALDDGCSHGKFDEAAKTLGLPEYSWADGATRLTKLWVNPLLVKTLTYKGERITRRQARVHGFHILPRPLVTNAWAKGNTAFDPLGDAQEMHYEYCHVCHDYYASEHECCHLRYQEGGYFTGCGADDADFGAAQRSIYALLEVLPPEVTELLFAKLQSGDSLAFDAGRDFDRGAAEFRAGRPHFGNITIDLEVLGREAGAEDRYWEGLCWLHSLDKRAKEATALTLGWLWQWKRQKWKGTCVLSQHIPLYCIPRAEFDRLFALNPNDTDAIPVVAVDFKTLRKQGGCLNTTNFLSNPGDAKALWLMLDDRDKTQDHRSLHYRIAKVAYDKRRAVITLARCLDHNGTHPSSLPGYEIIEPRTLEWLRKK